MSNRHCSVGMLLPGQQSFFPAGFDIEVRSECIYG